MTLFKSLSKARNIVYPSLVLLSNQLNPDSVTSTSSFITSLCMTSFFYNLVLAILSATMPTTVQSLLKSAMPIQSGIFGLISFSLFQANSYFALMPAWLITSYSSFEIYVVPLIYFSIEIIILLEFIIAANRYLREQIDFSGEWYT